MKAITPASLDDLARAVLCSDGLMMVASKGNLSKVRLILETAFKKVGLATLGGSTVDVDLGNGHCLRCKVVKTAPARQEAMR